MRTIWMVLGAAALMTACNRGAAREREDRSVAMPVSEPAPGLMARRESFTALGKSAGAMATDAVDAPAPTSVAAHVSNASFSHAFGDSVVGSMLIRTGQVSLRVDSLGDGIAAVRSLATHVGGYVANSSIEAGADQGHTATLELKIPTAHFDEAIGGLKPIGALESVNVTVEDVGEEYVDVAARAESGRKLEQRLIDILGTRTGKLSDVLSVERELARVREEIERQEGRMRYLRTRAAYSTLAVTVHERMPVVAGTGSGGVLAESFRQAWRNFIGFVASAIAALGTLLPLALIFAAVVWGALRVWRDRHAVVPEAKG